MTFRKKASSIGIVYNRASGAIVRVFNPTFEFELDLHHVDAHEFMLRFSKKECGISLRPDAMTPEDVFRVVKAKQ
jgi:hypothetical protein